LTVATAREQIRDAVAFAALQVATQVGVSLTFTTRSGAAVTVYGVPEASVSSEGLFSGQTTDSHKNRFTIPKQTGFDPAAVDYLGATITWGAIVWPVTGANVDSVGASLTADCEYFGLSVEYGVDQ
jgi:hypothetical protein